MDQDMDAPQISTLREEDTPPPRRPPQSKFRVKLVVKDNKNTSSLSTSATRKRAPVEDEDEDEEDEEDQLIDDVDISQPTPSASRHGEASHSKRKPTASKRKVSKTTPIVINPAPPAEVPKPLDNEESTVRDNETEEEEWERPKIVAQKSARFFQQKMDRTKLKRKRESEADHSSLESKARTNSGILPPGDNEEPIVRDNESEEEEDWDTPLTLVAQKSTRFFQQNRMKLKRKRESEANNSSLESKARTNSGISPAGIMSKGSVSARGASSASTSPKKITKAKGQPRKSLGDQRPTAKAPARAKSIAAPVADDVGILSEGYTVTAASSPVTAPHYSPEPENTGPPHAFLIDETNIDSVPWPVYPLPSKPFPVQPPPKIGTGFAPVIPLDRTANKARRWRIAHREIRGIAGGRWFARTWVGDKDSELALAAAAAKANPGGDGEKSSLSLAPKLSASAGSSVKGSGKGKGAKAQATVSAGPSSRAGSALPDPPSISAARPPTKMRTIVTAPPSDGNESDMAPQAMES